MIGQHLAKHRLAIFGITQKAQQGVIGVGLKQGSDGVGGGLITLLGSTLEDGEAFPGEV
jgi:hypothetical protein